MKFNFDGDEPIYLQVADFISEAILLSVYGTDQQIPSSTEISVNYKINPATVQKGIKLLTDEGVLYKKRGVGMFVSQEGREILINKRKADFVSSYISPLVNEAKRLGISEEEIIKMMRNND